MDHYTKERGFILNLDPIHYDQSQSHFQYDDVQVNIDQMELDHDT